jgi:hypothetical protein
MPQSQLHKLVILCAILYYCIIFITAVPDSKDPDASRSGYWQKRVSGEVKDGQKNKEDAKEEASG